MCCREGRYVLSSLLTFLVITLLCTQSLEAAKLKVRDANKTMNNALDNARSSISESEVLLHCCPSLVYTVYV